MIALDLHPWNTGFAWPEHRGPFRAITPDQAPAHQDNGYTYVEPQAYLTCWVALTDATLENGCVQARPGIHRGGAVAHERTPIG